MTTSEEIKAEYTSSLQDLTCNSKPLINVLTMLAEENIQNAPVIVDAIETHLSKVDEKTRAEMFRLRQTWNDVFPQKKLYAIDVQINTLDPAWPVTAAPPPSNSIHFNPKFLKSATTNTNNTKLKTDNTPQLNAPSIDTLKMQEKLIQKQKELLELKQKKLELEVLQTQVQIQEQIKKNPTAARPNILLKPEVAKQMISPAATVANVQDKKPTMNAVLNQRLMNQGNSTTRISPASSALVSAVSKPIRDPRLLKQQKPSNIINSNVQLGQKSSVLDSNKIVTNKKSVRDNRNEPRLISNKDDAPPSQTKTDTNNKSKTYTKSRQSSDTHKSSSTSSKSSSSSSSRSSTKGSNNNNSNAILESDNVSKSNSNKLSNSSLLDSPIKNKSEKSSSSSSSSKSPSSKHNKKRDNNSSSSSSSKSDDKKGTKESNKRDKLYKSDNNSPTSFKCVKSSSKNRNYVRRNLSPMSPEPPQDEDLRPFATSDKQARLLSDTTDEKSSIGADIDLRQLPSVIGKKRPSTESIDQNITKKSKSEVMHALFGNEDTDLRQLTVVNNDRPPTPPPPIISSNDNSVIEITDSPKKSNNFDAIRAKLANATSGVLSKSFNKKKMMHSGGNEERNVVRTNNNMSGSIIISADEEQCIKQGTLTKERSTQLLSKIITQFEKSKLREAKKKEHERSFGNISLQPISDEELEDDYSDEERNGSGSRQSYDKDDRFGSNHDPDYGGKYSRRGGVVNWRGARRRVWDTTPIPMGPITRPGGARTHSKGWMQQTKNWRQMGPNTFGSQQQQQSHSSLSDFVPTTTTTAVAEDEGGKSPDVSTEIVVDSVNQDDIKTINIDSIPRDIRYYDNTAIIFLNWDDPREISFQDGNRRVTFNDKDTYVFNFNEPDKDVLINGVMCKVRLGTPSREIYINGNPYECFFGGASITIDLNGINTQVKLDGPAPQVKIGTCKRIDLVAGKVNLIVNAKIIVPLYLDAKIQKFVVDGETVTLKFVDALKTVLINDVPFNVEFGGLPKPITIHNKKHFVRFSVLPRGIRPGHVNIKDMGGIKGSSSGDDTTTLSPIYDENSQDSQLNSFGFDANEPALPVFGNKMLQSTTTSGGESPERNSNSPHFFQSLLQQQNLNNLDVLSNVMASSINSTSSFGGYQVEQINQPVDSQANSEQTEPTTTSSSLPQLPASNINDLFQKLVATGIITTSAENNTKPTVAITTNPARKYIEPPPQQQQQQPPLKPTTPYKRNPLECLKPILFTKPETLKVRQMALYSLLYSGMQCSSCGMRFPPEQSMQYSQHLDWHFRQNRKGKKNIRVAASRRWYYSISDWKNYEEIEDLEEREKNYFDQQLTQAENNGEEAEEEVEIPSVPADSDITDSRCEVCQDVFDQFFNEEKEEWHLRNAIRIDGKTYHPVCYDDYQMSLQEQSMDDSKMDVSQDNDESAEEIRTDVIPGLEIILDDDEESEKDKTDDKTETEEVVIEESDESKTVSEEPKENDVQNDDENVEEDDADEDDDGDDDDVILNEVAPIKIVVDDDDDYTETHENLDTPTIKVEKMDTSELDDGFVDVSEGLMNLKNGGNQIKIKAEPLDSDELPMELEEPFEEIPQAKEVEEELKEFTDVPTTTTTTHTGLVSSIDGNVELESGVVPSASTGIGGKIKINISKPLPVIASKENKDNTPNDTIDNQQQSHIEPLIDPSQPLPPGEEPVQLNLKPALKGVSLKKMPPVKKGSELSGLCSIM